MEKSPNHVDHASLGNLIEGRNNIRIEPGKSLISLFSRVNRLFVLHIVNSYVVRALISVEKASNLTSAPSGGISDASSGLKKVMPPAFFVGPLWFLNSEDGNEPFIGS